MRVFFYVHTLMSNGKINSSVKIDISVHKEYLEVLTEWDK